MCYCSMQSRLEHGYIPFRFYRAECFMHTRSISIVNAFEFMALDVCPRSWKEKPQFSKSLGHHNKLQIIEYWHMNINSTLLAGEPVVVWRRPVSVGCDILWAARHITARCEAMCQERKNSGGGPRKILCIRYDSHGYLFDLNVYSDRQEKIHTQSPTLHLNFYQRHMYTIRQFLLKPYEQHN